MLLRLRANWWTLAVRGAVAVIFGVMALLWPVTLLATFVLLFGAYALVDGIFALVAAVRFAFEHERWLPMLVEAVIGIAVGVIVFLHLFSALVAIIWVVGAWALVTGILEICAAIVLRKQIEGEWLLALTGVLSVVLGFLLFAHPIATGAAYIWVIGIYAVISGISLLWLSFRMRRLESHIGTNMPHARPV